MSESQYRSTVINIYPKKGHRIITYPEYLDKTNTELRELKKIINSTFPEPDSIEESVTNFSNELWKMPQKFGQGSVRYIPEKSEENIILFMKHMECFVSQDAVRKAFIRNYSKGEFTPVQINILSSATMYAGHPVSVQTYCLLEHNDAKHIGSLGHDIEAHFRGEFKKNERENYLAFLRFRRLN